MKKQVYCIMYQHEKYKVKMADCLASSWAWYNREDVVSTDLDKLIDTTKYLNDISCDDEHYTIEEVPYEAY